MYGLNMGTIRDYLFLQMPASLEEAISTALQEEFILASGRTTKFAKNPWDGQRPTPMDIGTMQHSFINNSTMSHGYKNNRKKTSSFPKGKFKKKSKDLRCKRCNAYGHVAKTCWAPISANDFQKESNGGKSHNAGQKPAPS